jgi:tRNA-specific 2-thiouridylase
LEAPVLPENRQKALIAMSGGVDSSVAAWLMKEQGYYCVGVTMKLFASAGLAPDGPVPGGGEGRSCCSLKDVRDAQKVAFRMGMAHYVLNFSPEFKKEVIDRFVRAYEDGLTPNPCIDCNRYIKFESLLRRARELDFDYVVTGHYARIEKDGTRYLLKKALDPKKDQSYFLSSMTQEQLAHTLFPLGSLTKETVREIAAAQGFGNARKRDSQDICFVPGGDYPAFIRFYTGRTPEPGPFVDASGRVLGEHRGIIAYTIGQRRGLDLPGLPAAGNPEIFEPVYVKAIRPRDNAVVVGPDRELYAQSLSASSLTILPGENLETERRCTVKIRYQQREQPATVRRAGEDRLLVEFDAPQRAVTPGQALVLYDGDLVLGGGTIDRAGQS